jgi:hypothetical protein
MFFIMWIFIFCLGVLLTILGTLPIGKFPGFADDVAILKAPYGRILGVAVILWCILSRIFVSQQNIPAVIAISAALLVVTVVCLFFSADEPVR